MSEQDTLAFTKKYGPWAVIAGASHGVGAALADQVAAKGLHCVLVARREEALTDLKNQLDDRYGVEVLVVTLDLTLDDAADRLVAAVADREVGLLIYNAGGDPYITRFLDTPVEDWCKLLHLNTRTIMRCCHAFGGRMVARGAGGVLLVGSQAALGGVRKLAMYAATKSFAMTLGEGLWAEWKGQGVDVLNLLIGTVDTPTMRDAMVRQGIAGALTMQLAKAEDIAAIALRELPNGPTLIHPDDLAESPTGSHSGQARREHVLRISAESALFIGD